MKVENLLNSYILATCLNNVQKHGEILEIFWILGPFFLREYFMTEILFGRENLAQIFFKRRFPHGYLAGSLSSFFPVSFSGCFFLIL
jgi:hypothetical protein